MDEELSSLLGQLSVNTKTDEDIMELDNLMSSFIIKERTSEQETEYLIDISKRIQYIIKHKIPDLQTIGILFNELYVLFTLYKKVFIKLDQNTRRSRMRKMYILHQISEFLKIRTIDITNGVDIYIIMERLYLAYDILCHVYIMLNEATGSIKSSGDDEHIFISEHDKLHLHFMS